MNNAGTLFGAFLCRLGHPLGAGFSRSFNNNILPRQGVTSRVLR